LSLYDQHGHRKYLTPSERQNFIHALRRSAPAVQTFGGTLAYAGCRISEALALTVDRIDISDGVLIFESLKKRRRGIFRAVPVPPHLLKTISFVHSIETLQQRPDRGKGVRLWSWSRATAWRRVSEVMQAAGIAGLHATPKGLRHGFGIKAVTSDVPLNMAQKWLGHARLSTTAIYTNATGPEEKQIAQRMWM
jgi:integrase/recombinase XerD